MQNICSIVSIYAVYVKKHTVTHLLEVILDELIPNPIIA